MTDEKTTYDMREASAILAKARHDTHGQGYESEQAAAAQALLDAVVDLARSLHYAVVYGGADTLVSWATTRQHVGLRATPTGIYMWLLSYGQTSDIAQPTIEYDPASKKWVGTTDDAFIAPSPGEPKSRRSAAAVVAAAIVAALKS